MATTRRTQQSGGGVSARQKTGAIALCVFLRFAYVIFVCLRNSFSGFYVTVSPDSKGGVQGSEIACTTIFWAIDKR